MEIAGQLSGQMVDMVGGLVGTVGEEPEFDLQGFPEQQDEEDELTKASYTKSTQHKVFVRFCVGTVPTPHVLLPQLQEVTLTLEPEPCSLTSSPLREDSSSTRGSSPRPPAQTTESVAERIIFDVTPCVVQLLEKDEEPEEGSIVVVATN